jgi:hypothetical protein
MGHRLIALLIPVAIFIFSNSQAQEKAKFSFDEETFDFGSIKEENGSVGHKFVFTNTGNAPLVIQGVKASCGCTTPAWSREPIPPGEKGFVMAKYNPKNRPGSFRKSLSITSNADPALKVLYIQGMVEQKEKTAADIYRQKIGGLRFRYQSLNMDKVLTNQPKTRSFDFYNDSENAITLLDKVEKPDFVTVSFQPNVIEPQTSGKIIITYDATKKGDYGFVSDPIKIFTDESREAEKPLRVVATIEEYFPPMTAEQRARAPKLTFEETSYDFGSLKKNAVASTEFVFTNTGKESLNIRALKPNCGCTIIKLEKYDYAPGESGKIEVRFDATGRKGSQQKSIVIFSNDPSAPTQRLTIKARVDDIS